MGSSPPAPASSAETGTHNAPQIVLHVGAHKTASTHLQHTIRSQGWRLRRQDVTFLGPHMLRGQIIDLEPVARDPGLLPFLRALRMRTGFRRLCKGHKQVFVSDENLLGGTYSLRRVAPVRLYPDGAQRIGRLLRRLGIPRAKVLLAVRDPATHLVSNYSQRLFAGPFIPFDEYVKATDPLALRWSQVAEEILALPRVEELVIWRMEDYPRLLPQILGIAVTEGVARWMKPLEGARHQGLSARAHEQLAAWAAEGQFPPGAARKAREMFPKSGDVTAYAPLEPELLAQSALAYAEDLRRLEGRPGITLLRP
ncbi:hypothetical protein [Halodurantibacterium flavum]|uniref:Sulfotransferase n=1 Tax=Halodurantibacterium flavum TaxID=1382802 RepID=A0ABW4S3L5_9RHOB